MVGVDGEPFVVRELEPAFAERNPAAKKGKKGKRKRAPIEVGRVPENAGELAVEIVQWLVSRGLLDLLELRPSAKNSEGLGEAWDKPAERIDL